MYQYFKSESNDPQELREIEIANITQWLYESLKKVNNMDLTLEERIEINDNVREEIDKFLELVGNAKRLIG